MRFKRHKAVIAPLFQFAQNVRIAPFARADGDFDLVFRAIFDMIINDVIFQHIERRFRIDVALDVVACVKTQNEIFVVNRVVNFQNSFGHVAVNFFLVFVQKFHAAAFDDFQHFFEAGNNFLRAIFRIFVAVKEGEYPDVFAPRKFCDFHEFRKLFLLFLKAFFVVYADFSYRRTDGRKLHAFLFQHGENLFLEFFKRIVRNVLAVHVSRAHISFAEFVQNSDLSA